MSPSLSYVYIDNGNVIEKLDSLRGKLHNVEIFVVTDKETYPCGDVEFVVNDSLVSGLNQVLKKLNGKWVHFGYTSCDYNEIELAKLFDLSNDGVDTGVAYCLGSIYATNITRELLNFDEESIRNIELLEFDNVIVSRQVMQNMMFKTENSSMAMQLMSVEIISRLHAVIVLPLKRPKSNSHSRPELKYEKQWYQYNLEYYEKLLRSNVIDYRIQVLMVADIYAKFEANMNTRNLNLLDQKETNDFFDRVTSVLKLVDIEVLVDFSNSKYNKNIIRYFINCVIGDFDTQTRNLLLRSVFVKDYDLTVDIFKYNENVRHLEFDIKVTDLNTIAKLEFGKLILAINDRQYEFVQNHRYSESHAFGKTIFNALTFNCVIELNDIDHIYDATKMVNLEILLKSDSGFEKMTYEFNSKTSRLTKKYKNNYYQFANYVSFYNSKSNQIEIVKMNRKSLVKRELRLLKEIFPRNKANFKNLGYIALRVNYHLMKRWYAKKNVYLFFDKLYKAGDNGEYLFAYINKVDKQSKCYYIVNRESHEYKNMIKKYGRGRVLAFNSYHQKLMVLFADRIFATHADVLKFCGYYFNSLDANCGLINAKIACIQHGLTIQDIPQYQARTFDDTDLYFCASKYELVNLNKETYDYQPEVLKLTGLPRYDGLVDRKKGQILISPTWRRNITKANTQMGFSRGYNDEFKFSEYYRIYNDLINNEDLIATAKKYGYKLIFLLHPTLSSQKDDFITNEYVNVIASTSNVSYEDMMCESDVLVTDYSGIQFDFAYMKKPVVYFHPETLPPHYENSVFDYETMAFGEIVENENGLVTLLNQYMENKCQMKVEFTQRVDDFFEYSDHSNCKRIHDTIKETDSYRF